MFRQTPITHLVHLVQDEVEKIETRNERGWEINIGRNRQFRVISRVDGVGSGQDRGSSVQSRDNTRFGNRDCLLFLSIISCEPRYGK
jgi:hypothetical protein